MIARSIDCDIALLLRCRRSHASLSLSLSLSLASSISATLHHDAWMRYIPTKTSLAPTLSPSIQTHTETSRVACEDEVGAVVVDVGSSTTKAGYAGEDHPKCVIPSYVGMMYQTGDASTVGQGPQAVGEEVSDVRERERYRYRYLASDIKLIASIPMWLYHEPCTTGTRTSASWS